LAGAAADPSLLQGASEPFGQQSGVGTHSTKANAGKPAKNRLVSKIVRLKIRRNMIREFKRQLSIDGPLKHTFVHKYTGDLSRILQNGAQFEPQPAINPDRLRCS